MQEKANPHPNPNPNPNPNPHPHPNPNQVLKYLMAQEKANPNPNPHPHPNPNQVLKYLMAQEKALKAELETTRRNNAREDALNVEYLKNVVVAFLLKVYGDADDEEHIKLARVLQTILHFSPQDSARVAEKIACYESSWWHRTANLLKPVPEAALPEVVAGSAAAGTGGGPGSRAQGRAAESSAAPVSSWWGAVFGAS